MRDRYLIIGATSGIAKNFIYEVISEINIEIFLVARNKEKLAQLSKIILEKNPKTKIYSFVIDFLNPNEINIVIKRIFRGKFIKYVLIAQGILPIQKKYEKDLKYIDKVIRVNSISCILFSEAIIPFMQKVNQGTLALIGSVAGDRIRKSNYIYGVSKSMLEKYIEGLSHRLFKTKIIVQLIKPGPTRTKMTKHLTNTNLDFADPKNVAKDILNGMKKPVNIIYTPPKWKLIMLIIKNIPKFIFNRLDL